MKRLGDPPYWDLPKIHLAHNNRETLALES